MIFVKLFLYIRTYKIQVDIVKKSNKKRTRTFSKKTSHYAYVNRTETLNYKLSYLINKKCNRGGPISQW